MEAKWQHEQENGIKMFSINETLFYPKLQQAVFGCAKKKKDTSLFCFCQKMKNDEKPRYNRKKQQQQHNLKYEVKQNKISDTCYQ